MTLTAPLRVLVADDDAHYRTLLSELLAGSGFTVVGSAVDGRAAVELAGALSPDAVTMDLEMPRLDGVEATRAIAAAPGAPAVLIVSASTCATLLRRAFDAGAAARVAKEDAPSSLVPAVRAAVAAGRG